MDLNELPRDLVQFVQQEIAQGTYQSAAEVVSAALHLLREHKAQIRRQDILLTKIH